MPMCTKASAEYSGKEKKQKTLAFSLRSYTLIVQTKLMSKKVVGVKAK